MTDQILDKETFPVNHQTTKSQNEDVQAPSGMTHSFDTGYAIKYGVNEAIMIKNFQFFITCNANRGQHFHEGKYWTYDRMENFLGHFPYWSIQSIRTILKSLIDQKVLIKSEFNKAWSNRTAWYAFRDQDAFIKNIKPPKTACPVPESTDSPGKPQEIQKNSADLLKSTNDICWNQQMTDVEINKCTYSTSAVAAAVATSPSLTVPEEPGGSVSYCSSEVSEDAKQLLPEFIKVIQEIRPKFKRKPELLLKSLHGMLHDDELTSEEILRVLRWAVHDNTIRGDFPGWAAAILGKNPAATLRRNFDLIAQQSVGKKERKFLPCSDDNEALRLMKEMTARAL